MKARLSIANPVREAPGRYEADLLMDGQVVGHVERGLSIGGIGASDYRAVIQGTTYAQGRTLRDLREELRDPENVREVFEAVAALRSEDRR